MEKVTGIGGIFFKCNDKDQLKEWYQKHLGVDIAKDFAGAVFEWNTTDNPQQNGSTIWGLFDQDSEYFSPSQSPFMINYRVNDLDKMLTQLRKAGVTVDDKIEDSEFGKFGWGMDPEGNRFELWQPPENS